MTCRQARDAGAGDTRTALIRVEQLYPFPTSELAVALAAFPHLEEVVWAQEEEKKHGAWHFVRDEIEQAVPANCRIVDVCRRESPSGAHSSIRAHRDEQQRLSRPLWRAADVATSSGLRAEVRLSCYCYQQQAATREVVASGN